MKKVEANKLQKKNALLQSSFDLFVTNGFGKTTISEISKRAGLAKGTFYLYFKDKYDLRDKLIAHKAAQLFEEAHHAMAGKEKPHSFEDFILNVCDFFIHRFEEDPRLLGFLSKNLSWGIFKNALSADVPDEEMTFYHYFSEQLSQFQVHCEQPELMLFTVIELIGSSSYSCILYKQPVTMEEYLPFLHQSIRAIIQSYIYSSQPTNG